MDFLVLEKQLKVVGASSLQELLLRATVVKLKHLQVIVLIGETGNLAHSSQPTTNKKF